MASNSRILCKSLLTEVFGDLVAQVGDKLHQWNGQTFPQLLLPPRIAQTRECVAVLINHNIVTFKECPRTSRPLYFINEERIVALIKLPRYLVMCKTLFGDEGELIVEELFKVGQCSMSTVIFKAAKRLKMAKKDELGPVNDVVKGLKNKFRELADCQFLQRVPSPYTKTDPDPSVKTLPTLETDENARFDVPEINFKEIVEAVNKTDEDPEYELSNSKDDESKILWSVNYERFSREFRDQVVVQAVTRRIDASAGSLIRIMLQLMNENNPWAPISCHLRLNEVMERLESNKLADPDLREFPDQYFKVLEEDRTRFLDRVGDAGGGQYVVNVKHIFTELAASTIENIIMERYGSKALRIFRVIRQKLHVEESTLQNLVMIPTKETKLLTYTLMEANFIKVEELKKSMASTMGKTFFLFFVDLPQVARMVVDLCQKAIGNAFMRKKHEADVSKRLLDKHERIESIVANLKSSPDFEESEELQLQLQEVQDMLSPAERENVKSIHAKLDQLGLAANQIDETLFIMNTYLYYTMQ